MKSDAIIDVVIFVVGICLGALIAYTAVSEYWERKSVRSGHAEWIAKPDGIAAFQWKTNCVNVPSHDTNQLH